MPTTVSAPSELHIPLSDITVPTEGRPVDQQHVANLACSIDRLGQLVPVVLHPLPDGAYELVAGRHRHAACVKLGRSEILAVTREPSASGAGAATAVENIVRKQLTPLEEAEAVARVLAEGFSLRDAASVLGWSSQLVSARAKILELGKDAQRLIGDGVIPPRAIETLLAVHKVCPPLSEALAGCVAREELNGHSLVNNISLALHRGCDALPRDVFVAWMTQLRGDGVAALRLGKKTEALCAEAQELYDSLAAYAYGSPSFAFSELDLGQARSLGVLLELPNMAPLITDRKLYRELCKQAIERGTIELRERAAVRKEEIKQERAEKVTSPTAAAESEHRATMRELARRAHSVNLDLGASFLKGLARVKANDMNVARFFVFGLFGVDRESDARSIAATGVRLVFEQHRSTTTPTLKTGQPGKTKVAYAEPEAVEAWLWDFLGAAKTAEELYGRALVVFAAQEYALQITLPGSQRRGSAVPRSHKELARTSFEALVTQLLPGTYVELRRAIDAAAKAHQRRLGQVARAHTYTPEPTESSDD